uniref:Uncharacterized protein n=1 Tax=Anopheles melas TaxID=34690 RepID=A0A182TDP0_9DIPT
MVAGAAAGAVANGSSNGGGGVVGPGCGVGRYKHHSYVEVEEDEQDDDIIVIVDEDNSAATDSEGGGGSNRGCGGGGGATGNMTKESLSRECKRPTRCGSLEQCRQPAIVLPRPPANA